MKEKLFKVIYWCKKHDIAFSVVLFLLGGILLINAINEPDKLLKLMYLLIGIWDIFCAGILNERDNAYQKVNIAVYHFLLSFKKYYNLPMNGKESEALRILNDTIGEINVEEMEKH